MCGDPDDQVDHVLLAVDAVLKRIAIALEALGADQGLTRYVGGAVRDDLLDLAVSDVDLATRLQPEEVIRRLEAAKIKAVPTGIDHGTITAVSDGHPYEVTTLRRDVATDGRRATVAVGGGLLLTAAFRLSPATGTLPPSPSAAAATTTCRRMERTSSTRRTRTGSRRSRPTATSGPRPSTARPRRSTSRSGTRRSTAHRNSRPTENGSPSPDNTTATSTST